MKNTNDKYAADIKLLRETADQSKHPSSCVASLFMAIVVAERRRYPSDKKDILNSMLQDKDLKTGQKMSDKSITDNVRLTPLFNNIYLNTLLAFDVLDCRYVSYSPTSISS